MNRVLTIIGLVCTVIYTVGILLILNGRMGQLCTMPLNEIGDFFAGIFGPVAFLWLILGFLQQGKELQQSTKALELQATELNNSTEQQRKLVEVTKSQVKAEREALQIEKDRLSKAAKPNFIFNGCATNGGVDTFDHRTRIINTGATSTNVTISSNVKLKSISLTEVPLWKKDQEFTMNFRFEPGPIPDESIFTIRYIDSSSNKGMSEYKVLEKQEQSHLPQLDIKLIDS